MQGLGTEGAQVSKEEVSVAQITPQGLLVHKEERPGLLWFIKRSSRDFEEVLGSVLPSPWRRRACYLGEAPGD